MTGTRRNKAHIFTIALVAATGGLLFGFDTGVISGALPFIRDQWSLTESQRGLIVSSIIIGAVFGALFSGRITDIFSRRNTIIVTALMFFTGSVCSALSPDIRGLIISRIIIGIAIGVSSYVVPLYISEISPARNRGALVTLNQLMITLGILLSYLSNLGLVDVHNNWRWMFLVGIIPSLMLFFGMLFLPKTPRWLMTKGFEAEAKRTLDKIEDQSFVEDALLKMKTDLASDTEPHYKLKELFKPWHLTPFALGIGIMFVQQFIGINTFVYYGPSIFEMAGFDSHFSALAATVGIGVVNVFFTVIAIALLDKVGRKPLYYCGLTGMIAALVILASAFYYFAFLGAMLKWIVLAGILIYISFFAISLGPIAWLLVSEIFPLRIRGFGMSIATLSNWIFNCIITYSFLRLSNLLTLPGREIWQHNGTLGPNPAGAFMVYAIAGILGIILGLFFLPETKGYTLEEIEEHWKKRKESKDFKPQPQLKPTLFYPYF